MWAGLQMYRMKLTFMYKSFKNALRLFGKSNSVKFGEY